MQNHSSVPATLEVEVSESTTELSPRDTWQVEVSRLLSQAARQCVEHGLDVDDFMKGAWSAYLASRPGMREHLEEMQLREQLDELRKLGRLGAA